MGDCKILLTGASGYLGQHLLWHWMTNGIQSGNNPNPSSTTYCIVAVYNQNPGFASAVKEVMQSSSSSAKIDVIPVSCNLTRSADVDSLLEQYHFDICIHTAALSSPRVCQQDPEAAKRINVPEYFFEKLADVRLVALSTDQVYDGTKDTSSQGLYQEGMDVPSPLNVYGQTKVDMESFLLQSRSKTNSTVLLRSSIILGPKAPVTKAHETFLHFCASRNEHETTFFVNEYRTVVSVMHVCRVVDYFLLPHNTSGVFHLGGPVRVNRLDMAQAVFNYMDYDPKVLLPATQASSTVPLDISMDSSRLEKVTGIVHEPKTLQGMVELTLKGLK